MLAGQLAETVLAFNRFYNGVVYAKVFPVGQVSCFHWTSSNDKIDFSKTNTSLQWNFETTTASDILKTLQKDKLIFKRKSFPTRTNI